MPRKSTAKPKPATLSEIDRELDAIDADLAAVEAPTAAVEPEPAPLPDVAALETDQLKALLQSAAAELARRDVAARRIVEDARAEAAARQRAEAEAEAASKANDAAARLRAIATRARELFGSDQPEFTVTRWGAGADRRVYIGHGYDNNWVEYYHDGNARIGPGKLVFQVPAVRDELAAHLGITPDEAREMIREFCRGLADAYGPIKIEVSEANAPRDPAAQTTLFALKLRGDRNHYAQKGVTHRYDYRLATADKFATADEARAAIPEYLPPLGRLAQSADDVELVEVPAWLPFPRPVHA